MNILSAAPQHGSDEVTEYYLASLYPLSGKVLDVVKSKLPDKNNLFLFCGSFRLDFDGTYVEHVFSRDAEVSWHKNTIFVNDDLERYTLEKLKPSSISILNSASFLKYRHWERIMSDMRDYRSLCDMVIVTAPINRIDFNRIKYSNSDIAEMMGADLVEDTLVLCR